MPETKMSLIETLKTRIAELELEEDAVGKAIMDCPLSQVDRYEAQGIALSEQRGKLQAQLAELEWRQSVEDRLSKLEEGLYAKT